VAGQFAASRRIGIDDQGFEKYQPESEAARELREVAASFRLAGVDFEVHPDPDEADEVGDGVEADEPDEANGPDE
jgi:hypothetical protein